MKRIEPASDHIRYASNYIYCKGVYFPRPLFHPLSKKLEHFDRECEATIYMSGIIVVTEENQDLPTPPLNPTKNDIVSQDEMQALLLSIAKPVVYISSIHF